MTPESEMPTYGLPSSADNDKLLLVSLTDLHNDAKEIIIKHLQNLTNTTLLSWSPSSKTLQSIAKQGTHKDSKANLYAIAILAYRAGWTGLLVADELTKRQLTGALHVGEPPETSVVMISIKPSSLSTTTPDTGVHVVAKRTTGKEGENKTFLEALNTFEPQEEFNRKESIYNDRGLVLHDPDRGLLAGDTHSMLGWEERSEIADETPIALPSLVNHGEHSLVIFLMFPTTEEESHYTLSALQNASRICDEHNEEDEMAQPLEIQVIPWKYHKTASRRGLVSLWEEYQNQFPHGSYSPFIYLLREPVEDVNHVQVGVVQYTMHEPFKVSWRPLHEVMEIARRCSVIGLFKSDNVDFHGDEVFLPFDEPFYRAVPSWHSADYRANWISVFYLTDALTPEQDEAIRSEIYYTEYEDKDWPKVVCFVPWTLGATKDGDLETMWDILWEVHTYKRGFANPYSGTIPIFFIDRQSAVDQTVIAVETDYLYLEEPNALADEILKGVYAPTLRGFHYARVPGREAHSVHANLDLGNLLFEELADNIAEFKRPGWPGHGILQDSDYGC